MLRCATPTMNKMLDKIDLNLLKALLALVEERSVTRAANRLFITQSAMSKSLQRLRELFADPLLVRGSDGLVLTPRAAGLIEPLREIATKLEDCLTPPSFEPALAEGRIRIAAPEQFAFVTVPDLLVTLRQKAPKLSLEAQHLMDNHLDMLASGALDFVVFRDTAFPRDFPATHIYSSVPMCWCRKGHPLTGKPQIGLTDIFSYPLVTLRAQNFSPEDVRALRQELAAASLTNETILDTSHMIVAIDALIRCDALMLAPDFLSRLPLVESAINGLPIAHIRAFSRFRTDLFLIQHRRSLNSPLHRWVAAEIAAALST